MRSDFRIRIVTHTIVGNAIAPTVPGHNAPHHTTSAVMLRRNPSNAGHYPQFERTRQRDRCIRGSFVPSAVAPLLT